MWRDLPVCIAYFASLLWDSWCSYCGCIHNIVDSTSHGNHLHSHSFNQQSSSSCAHSQWLYTVRAHRSNEQYMHSVKKRCPNFFHWMAKTETQRWAMSQNQHLLCGILNMQNGPRSLNSLNWLTSCAKCHNACHTQIMENSNYRLDVFKEHFLSHKKIKQPKLFYFHLEHLGAKLNLMVGHDLSQQKKTTFFLSLLILNISIANHQQLLYCHWSASVYFGGCLHNHKTVNWLMPQRRNYCSPR